MIRLSMQVHLQGGIYVNGTNKSATSKNRVETFEVGFYVLTYKLNALISIFSISTGLKREI